MRIVLALALTLAAAEPAAAQAVQDRYGPPRASRPALGAPAPMMMAALGAGRPMGVPEAAYRGSLLDWSSRHTGGASVTQPAPQPATVLTPAPRPPAPPQAMVTRTAPPARPAVQPTASLPASLYGAAPPPRAEAARVIAPKPIQPPAPVVAIVPSVAKTPAPAAIAPVAIAAPPKPQPAALPAAVPAPAPKPPVVAAASPAPRSEPATARLAPPTAEPAPQRMAALQEPPASPPARAAPRYYSLHREFGLEPDAMPPQSRQSNYVLIGPGDEPKAKSDNNDNNDKSSNGVGAF